MNVDRVVVVFSLLLCVVFLLRAIFLISDPSVILPVFLSIYLIFGRVNTNLTHNNLNLFLLLAVICVLTAWLQSAGILDPNLFSAKKFYSRVDNLDFVRSAGILSNKSSFSLICITCSIILYKKSVNYRDDGAIYKFKLAIFGVIFFASSLLIPQGRAELPIALALLGLTLPLLISSKHLWASLIYISMFFALVALIWYFWDYILLLIDIIYALGGNHRSEQVEIIKEAMPKGTFIELLFGIGLDRYQTLFNDQVIHHYFWKMLFELGLLASFFCFGLICVITLKLWIIYRAENLLNRALWITTLCVSLLIVITHSSMVTNGYFYLTIFIIHALAKKVKYET